MLELEPGWSPERLCLMLDGADVSHAYAVRTDRAWPPRRAEVVLSGLAPGPHKAELSWPGTEPHAWRFTVPP